MTASSARACAVAQRMDIVRLARNGIPPGVIALALRIPNTTAHRSVAQLRRRGALVRNISNKES